MGKSYLIVILAVIAGVVGTMEFQCLKCICDVMTDCKLKPCDPIKCAKVDGNNFNCACGPFAITPPYWLAANSPLLDNQPGKDVEKFRRCAETFPCSIWAVQYYMQKNAVDCDGDKLINCHDYVLIQYFGVAGCKNATLSEAKLEKYRSCMKQKNTVMNSVQKNNKKTTTTTKKPQTTTIKVKPEELDVDSIENIDPFDEFDDDDKIITDDTPQQMRESKSGNRQDTKHSSGLR